MKTLHTQAIQQTFVSSKKLFRLERQGRYAEALLEIEEFWREINSSPETSRFSPLETAEIMLRYGVLIGFHGHNHQIPNAQIRSKNILTEARQRFIEFFEVEKTVECENYLALAYWRTGEINEALAWVEESFSRKLSEANPTRLYTYIIKSLLNLSIGNFQENIKLAEQIEEKLNLCGDPFLNGSFSTNVAVAYEKLGNSQRALHYLELARYYHQRSRHKVYLGTVENNLAQLYKMEKRFQQAHLASDNATKIFKQIKDRTREGFSLDTKAQIFLQELKFKEAYQTSEKALKIISQTENKAYLIETMLTKIKALIYLDEISAATLCLFEAVEIAKIHINENAANELVKEFEHTLRKKIMIKTETKITSKAEKTESDSNRFADNHTTSEKEFEFVLPPAIAHYSNIQVVQIQNTHLESVGLKLDSLAIVVQETIKRGDLIALSEIETEAVRCGFYDCDFGIICLEGVESEPQLFDEDSIEILGKIVGVCEPPTNAGAKLFVQTLKL